MRLSSALYSLCALTYVSSFTNNNLQLQTLSSFKTGLFSHQQKKDNKGDEKEKITDTYYNYNNEISTRRDAILSTTAKAISAVTASNYLIPDAYADTTTTADDITGTTTKIPTVQLGKSSSLIIPRTIQGQWQLSGGHGKYTIDSALSNMEAHYKAGMTALDTADIYGNSETIVGKFVSSHTNKGDDVVTPLTKFCCYRFLDEIDRNEVRERINAQRQKLCVDKLPLVQFFWSNYDVKKYVDVALYLTELKEEGLIGEIGATNFDLIRLKELKEAGVPLVSHQVQLSALDQRPVQSGMADWCKENDISLLAFGTVCSGILSDQYLNKKDPPTNDKLNTASLRLYNKTVQRFGSWQLVQELLSTMNDIATQVKADGRSSDGDCNVSNIAQRYVLDTKGVDSIIIGVRNQNHIAENVRTHSFTLKEEEREAIDNIVKKRKGPQGDVWDIERGGLYDKK